MNEARKCLKLVLGFCYMIQILRISGSYLHNWHTAGQLAAIQVGLFRHSPSSAKVAQFGSWLTQDKNMPALTDDLS